MGTAVNALPPIPEGFQLKQNNENLPPIPEGFQLKQQPKEKKESFGTAAFRAVVQPFLGSLSMTKYGFGAQVLKELGQAEAEASYEELEESLPRLRELFPDVGLPEKIDREKYMEAVKYAGKSVPTVENLAALTEHITGLPLEPKTEFDQMLRFIGQASKFGKGTPAQKFGTGLKAATFRQFFKDYGLPDPFPDWLAFAYGLFEKTPGIKKAKVKPEKPPLAPEIKPELPSTGPEVPPTAPGTPPGAPPIIPQGEIPPPTSTTNLQPGKTIPQTTPTFAEKENIIEQLNALPTPKELPIKPKFPEIGEGKPLVGRATEAKELGEAISKEPFHSEAAAGRAEAHAVQKAQHQEKKLVTEAYKEAEAVTANHNAIYEDLASKNEQKIKHYEGIEKRNAGQEAVYQQRLAVRRMIGTPEGLIEVNAARLMKQADSFSTAVNYEEPFAGYKSEVKSLVRDINQAVIKSLEINGKNALPVISADARFSRYANRFFGDEISAYLQQKILNPESLARKAIKDEGTYRALKDAIGSRKSSIINKLDREIVHQDMNKYYKDPELVNSKQYQKDLANLAEKIGKEKTAEVDYLLRQRVRPQEIKVIGEKKIKEAVSKLPKKELEKPKTISERIKPKIEINEPEALGKYFNSRSNIRKLKAEMKSRGMTKEFEKLVQDEIKDIFKEGIYGEKKLTGVNMKRIMDKNHEVLSELMGTEEFDQLYKIASDAGKKEITKDFIKDYAKKVGKVAIKFAGFGKIISLLPI